jgi:hypothetical protein
LGSLRQRPSYSHSPQVLGKDVSNTQVCVEVAAVLVARLISKVARETSDDDLVSRIQHKRENKFNQGETLDEGTFAFMHWLSNLADIPNVEKYRQNMLAGVLKNICKNCKTNSSN